MWHAFTEPEAIAYLTRRDVRKLVVVRNPFARIVSAYINKHVKGGGPDGWGRRAWNRVSLIQGARGAYMKHVLRRRIVGLRNRPLCLRCFLHFGATFGICSTEPKAESRAAVACSRLWLVASG